MLLAAMGLLAIAGRASAVPIPFQVTGSELHVDFDWGGGSADYVDNAMLTPETLDEGDSFEFDFGTIAGLGFGQGTLQLLIHLATPTPDGSVTDLGTFGVFLFWGSTNWGATQSFDYSFGGATGGIFSLNMLNIEHGSSPWTFSGIITNVKSPNGAPVTPVPEPGVLLLLGGGLLAFAAVRRRKAMQS